MRTLDRDTLLEVRERLSACLELMHDEANVSAKEEVIRAIAVIDQSVEVADNRLDVGQLLELIGKIIEKLPWILSLFEGLD